MWTLRPPQREDWARMAELAGQLGYPSTAEQIGARLGGMAAAERYFARVAEEPPGGVAGWITAHVFRSGAVDAYAEITALVVEETLRSRGIGLVLLGAAEGWARGLGYGAIRVHTNVIRERTHVFYKRHGYVWVKSQHLLSKPL